MRLRQLGGSEIVPIGLGDDQAPFGFLSSFIPWCKKLFDCQSGLPPRGVIGRSRDRRPIHSIEYGDATDSSSNIITICRHCSRQKDVGAIYRGVVDGNRRLTAADWYQDVRSIRISPQQTSSLLSSSTTTTATDCWTFAAGDVCEVYPENSAEAVERILRIVFPNNDCSDAELINRQICIRSDGDALGCQRSKILKGDALICTVGHLFRRVLDLSSYPHRSFFERLSLFATDDAEAEKLKEIAQPEGLDLYYDYCVRERRSCLEILEDFKSARPPLDYLLELLPVLRPRSYSIASAPDDAEGGEVSAYSYR